MRSLPELVAAPVAPGVALALGRLALPLTQAQPPEVGWRGHQKERHLTSGLVQHMPVYRLVDGYWDCCREEKLRVAQDSKSPDRVAGALRKS